MIEKVIEHADTVAPTSGLIGVSSTLISLAPELTEIAQLIAAGLGVVATSLAIYLYVLRICYFRNKKNTKKD